MARKPKTDEAVGICPYHENLGCADKSSCASCGWNPNSDVRKRRIRAVMRDREEKLRAGKVHVYI